MSSQFTKKSQEFTKRVQGKDGTGQSKIKRTDIFGKTRSTGEDV